MLHGLVQTTCELDIIDSQQEHRVDTVGIQVVNIVYIFQCFDLHFVVSCNSSWKNIQRYFSEISDSTYNCLVLPRRNAFQQT